MLVGGASSGGLVVACSSHELIAAATNPSAHSQATMVVAKRRLRCPREPRVVALARVRESAASLCASMVRCHPITQDGLTQFPERQFKGLVSVVNGSPQPTALAVAECFGRWCFSPRRVSEFGVPARG